MAEPAGRLASISYDELRAASVFLLRKALAEIGREPGRDDEREDADQLELLNVALALFWRLLARHAEASLHERLALYRTSHAGSEAKREISVLTLWHELKLDRLERSSADRWWDEPILADLHWRRQRASTAEHSALACVLGQLSPHASPERAYALLLVLLRTPDSLAAWTESLTDALAALAQEAPPVAPVSGPAPIGAAGPAPSEPLPLARDNVQFTVFRPRRLRPMQWSKLLAFAHLAEKRPDAPPGSLDPLQQVQQQAQALLGDAGAYRTLSEDASQPIPLDARLTFVPTAPDLEFEPERAAIRWLGDVQHAEFRVRAPARLAGSTVRGQLTVLCGSFVVAELALALHVDAASAAREPPAFERGEPVRMYRKIFASYSHLDAAIVNQVSELIAAIGDRYLIDVRDLRAGERWSDALEALIRDADVFQLFWSSRSMRSPFVRQEWQYALSLARPNFVRPTYWEQPLPSSPAEGLPPSDLAALHFQSISAAPALRQPRPEHDHALPAAPPPPRPKRMGRALAASGALLVAALAALPAMLNQVGPPPAGINPDVVASTAPPTTPTVPPHTSPIGTTAPPTTRPDPPAPSTDHAAVAADARQLKALVARAESRITRCMPPGREHEGRAHARIEVAPNGQLRVMELDSDSLGPAADRCITAALQDLSLQPRSRLPHAYSVELALPRTRPQRPARPDVRVLSEEF
jgi:hypothetical protein